MYYVLCTNVLNVTIVKTYVCDEMRNIKVVSERSSAVNMNAFSLQNFQFEEINVSDTSLAPQIVEALTLIIFFKIIFKRIRMLVALLVWRNVVVIQVYDPRIFAFGICKYCECWKSK